MHITAECYNPIFNAEFEVFPIDTSGEGRAISQKIQANINCDSSGPQVLYVSNVPYKNNGCIEINLESGYRLTGAFIQIDPNDIYTDMYSNPGHNKPGKDIIKNYTPVTFSLTGDSSGLLQIASTNQFLMGTINFQCIVTYRKL